MNVKFVSAKSCTLVAAGGFLLSLMGCSSNGAATSTAPLSVNSAPAILTVTDAPLANILSAQVTISSVALTPSGGTSPVTILTTPTTVELSGLNGIQEPLDIGSLPQGTYATLTASVSSVLVTYVNGSGQTVTASATIASPTVTITLNPALTVNSTAGVDLHLAYNLASAFSINGNTVTFTPAVTAASGSIDSENAGQRQVEVTGPVVSISNTSLVVTSADSGRQFTFALNSSTQFPMGTSAGSILPGAIVHVQGQVQSDGSFLASSVSLESGQASGGSSGKQVDGGKGIVTTVSLSGGMLSGFSFVPRESFGGMQTNSTVTALVSSATTFVVPMDALNVGVPANSLTAASLFAGQSVSVTGAVGNSGTLNAAQVTLAGQGTMGVLTAIPQGSAPNLKFTIALPTTSFLTTYAGITSMDVLTNQATDYGDSLTAATFAGDPAGTNLEVHGYLIMIAPGSYVLYADEVNTASSSTDH